MALKRLVIDGYGQLELNQVAFRRDGRIEAQCALGSAFSSSVPAENGMLLAVDYTARKANLPAAATDKVLLNYTTEHMYDERHKALKDFYLVPGTFCPRLGYLATGDKYTTNCIAYDDGYASDSAFLAAVAANPSNFYAAPCTLGAHAVSADSANAVAKVVKVTTMPDGQPAIQFVAL